MAVLLGWDSEKTRRAIRKASRLTQRTSRGALHRHDILLSQGPSAPFSSTRARMTVPLDPLLSLRPRLQPEPDSTVELSQHMGHPFRSESCHLSSFSHSASSHSIQVFLYYHSMTFQGVGSVLQRRLSELCPCRSP